MSFLNIMKNKLKPKDVANVLNANADAVADINALIGATPLPQGETITHMLVEGGGGSSQYQETELFESETGIKAGNIVLSDNINNYDVLAFIIGHSSFPEAIAYTEISAKLIYDTIDSETGYIMDAVAYRYISVKASNNNTLFAFGSADECCIRKVIGIKY